MQVPYTLVDEDIPDDWACEHNTWDPEHRSCAVPQALSDERIDEILLQQVQLEVRRPARFETALRRRTNTAALAARSIIACRACEESDSSVGRGAAS